MTLLKRWLLSVAAALCVGAARGASVDPIFDSSNDYGDVGLLQTPSARMRPDGQFGLGVSSVNPYNQAHFFLQLTPWLESTIRYTSVTNEPYSQDRAFSTENYKDRSADFKVKLLNEGTYFPEIALGVQDIGGTGLFSGEYLVSSYHFYDLDFSLGLGWGRLGSRGGIHNPFTIFGNHFDKDRTIQTNAGQIGLSSLFTGEQISPFGGVQWRTPIKNVFLKLEYNGNNYQHEAFDNNFKVYNPVNVGIDYRPWKGVQLGVGYERGNTLMMQLSIGINLQQFKGLAKLTDPRETHIPVPALGEKPANQSFSDPNEGDTVSLEIGSRTMKIEPRLNKRPERDSGLRPSPEFLQNIDSHPLKLSPYLAKAVVDDKSRFFLATKKELNRQGIVFAGMTTVDETHTIFIWVNETRYRNPAEVVDRVARTLCVTAPADILTFTIIKRNAGVETSRTTLPRTDFERVATFIEEPSQLLEKITLSPPKSDGQLDSATVVDETRFPAFSWGSGPALRQSIGGPEDFYFAQVWWRADAELAITDHLTIAGTAGANIYNNFENLNLQSNSVLPHVRSDIAEYLKKGENNIVRLESDYVFSPLSQVYARASAGIFEEMYGGVAAEVLWRPYGKSWAFGLDGNWLKQRDYNQLFDFRSYHVFTGFLDFYYQLPIYHVLVKLSAGQYLAKDRGATIDLSRVFANGVRAGTFATKTNVTAAQFGEGSFDKGVYISIPLDLFFTNSSRTYAGAAFRPTTRDGGQRATDGPELYGLTDDDSPRDFADGWSSSIP